MNILKRGAAGVLAGVASLIAPYEVFAQQNPFKTGANLANNVAGAAQIQSQSDLPTLIGKLINIALGFLGIIFLLLTLYAGFLWMTARGDDKMVGKARDMLQQAVIGLIVIVAAFAISTFVLNSLYNVTQ